MEMNSKIDIQPINSSELKDMVKYLINKPEDVVQRAEELRKENILPNHSSNSIVKESSFIEVCFNKLYTFISSNGPNNANNHSILLMPENKEKVEDIIFMLKSKTCNNLLQFQLYKFLNNIEIFSLELIWKLQKRGLITIEAFLLQSLNQAQILALFSRSLVALCLMEDEREIELKLTILTDILPSLVMCAFNKETLEIEQNEEKSVQSVCQIIFESFLQKISCDESLNYTLLSEKNNINIMQIICESPVVDSTTIKIFCKFALNYIISHNPIMKASQAISDQHKWSFKSCNTRFISVVRKLILVLKEDNVINLLEQALKRQEVNWRTLLTTVSIVLVCSKEAHSLLQDFINNFLKESFEKLEVDHLISCFLITRQCVLEGAHYFPSYETWFQNHFGDISTSLANNSRTFNYFIKFLISLVPYEPSHFLKAHLLRPPSVPSKCRPIFNDYIILVKTRLQDLKENFDQVGIYSEICINKDRKECGNSKFSTQAELDVNKALLLFETTGKIPSTVVEASLFHKSYFIGQFLPALLSPRPLADVPDCRAKFIDELKKLNKLSVSLYDKYQKECERETVKFLEGVIMDEPFEEDFNNLFVNMQKTITFFCKSLEDGNYEPERIMLLINQLSITVQSVLKETDELFESNKKIICLNETVDEHSLLSKVVQTLLEAFVHCANFMELTYSEQKNDWDILFISMISNFGILHKPFFLHLWKKLFLHVDSSEINSLSLCLLRITERTDVFPKVLQNISSQSMTLCEAVFNSSKLETHQLMQNTLKLCTVYLRHVSKLPKNKCHQFLIPSSLVKKFQFTAIRLCPKLRGNNLFATSDTEFDEAVLLFNSNLICNVDDEKKLSLKDWILYEAKIEPSQDNFKLLERCEYINWYIYCIILPDQKQKNNKRSLEEICSCIFSIIANDMEVPSFCELLLVLQKLSLCLPLSESNKLPWLLQEFKNITEITNISNYTSVNIQYQLHSYFRIASLLPPYLFYSNKQERIDEYTLITLKGIIKDVLRPYFLEIYYFPVNLTCYLWKGIASLFNSSYNQHLVEYFINDSPVLISSLVTHWSTIGTILSQVILTKENNLLISFLGDIEENINLISKIENYHSEIKNKWISGLALAEKLNSSLDAANIFAMIDPEILQMALYFLVARLSADIIQVNNQEEDLFLKVKPVFLELIKYLISHTNDFYWLKPQCYKNIILKDIFLSSTLNLFSTSLLLICLQFWKYYSHQIIEDNNKCAFLITAIMINLNDCLMTMDCFYGKPSNNDNENIHANDLYFVVKLTQEVKSVISTVPFYILKLVPKDVTNQYELDTSYR